MFTRKSQDKTPSPAENREFESVEVSFDGIECSHQFRIWNGEPCPMFVLVKHSSTKIQQIIKEEQGRFRGHYVVGLALAESANAA